MINIPILQMRSVRARDVPSITWGNGASKWQSPFQEQEIIKFQVTLFPKYLLAFINY